MEKSVNLILKDMKFLKEQLQQRQNGSHPTDILDAVGGALRENLSEEQLKVILAWLSKTYSPNHSEALEKVLRRPVKSKASQPNQGPARQGKPAVEISEKKLRSHREKAGPSQKGKKKGKANGDGNDSQVSIPAQSEGTFTNTDLNFLNDTQDLAETKKIDTTMSVQAMHN